MTASLIEKLKVIKPYYYAGEDEWISKNSVITLIREHAASPEVVEEVAKRLCVQYQIDDGYSEDSGKHGDMWKNFRIAAQAAIAAFVGGKDE